MFENLELKFQNGKNIYIIFIFLKSFEEKDKTQRKTKIMKKNCNEIPQFVSYEFFDWADINLHGVSLYFG